MQRNEGSRRQIQEASHGQAEQRVGFQNNGSRLFPGIDRRLIHSQVCLFGGVQDSPHFIRGDSLNDSALIKHFL